MIRILTYVVPALLKVLTPELLRSTMKVVISHIREGVENSETKIDDVLLLPLLDVIEKSIKIDEDIKED